jgi:hypothetical protein
MQLLVSYQPSSHYWPLQWLETGIFTAVALLVIGATVWLVSAPSRRRRRVRATGAGRDALALAGTSAAPS